MATDDGSPNVEKLAKAATAGIDLLVAEAGRAKDALAAASAELQAIDAAPIAAGTSPDAWLTQREAAVSKAALVLTESLTRFRKVLAGIAAAPPAGEQ